MKVSEFEVLLKELEVRLEHLKALYEQWFQGIERLPPSRRRETLARALTDLRRDQPQNTAIRFRFQTVWQRWITMTTHWDRVTRQIEEGTYRRDVLRARRRGAARDNGAPAGRQSIEIDVEMDLDDFDFDAEVGAAIAALEDRTEPEISIPAALRPAPATPSGLATFARPKEMTFRRPVASTPPGAPSSTEAPASAAQSTPARVAAPSPASRAVAPTSPSAAAPRPAPPGTPQTSVPRPAPPVPPRAPQPSAARAPMAPPQPSAARPPPPRPSPASLGELELRRIHAQYVDASRRAGASDMSYEKLAQRIKTMEPELKKKHGGKAIDFEVVVKDGRVGLKPIPKG